MDETVIALLRQQRNQALDSLVQVQVMVVELQARVAALEADASRDPAASALEETKAA